ncbi:acyl-[ACP]--phospholipid O-acyltransferase [Hyphomicrobium sp. DMF-1]|jgi:acyl-[acyl-carrier-protein]-phospholipid O-acyltransferase/long-chain-fatty-acid--[acyl-carrier-protein] ligase|uniref:acyl-[ACP]--phospholipid O-acyltransferase n=1 Tax=Hyphomicrobium sp. DMF-1 TaxID=3019544 RepID=UPI0022EC10EC|nr:acyl-[ACP]--phospholipid O-acyltransferase [Hyphomicrobium sp. DMF-1]WBT36351.1 acyl-[ACP]--phospholipid O-acyltransferase [Hyphomicrobium sp. DMF-1]
MFTALITSRRFAPLFWCQFLSALNDNFVKNALVILILFQLGSQSGGALVALAGAVLVAPFFILSGIGGELADRYDKAVVAEKLKRAEIPVAIIAAVGFVTHSVPVLFVALGLYGVIAALFGPIKYGILPALLEPRELPAGNAFVESATFAAILIGTIGGGLAASDANGVWVLAGLVVGLAALCWFSASLIPKTGAAAPGLAIDFNPWTSTMTLIRHLRGDRRLWVGGLITAWFWLVGTVVLSLLPVLIKDALGGGESVTILALVIFTIGIAVGSGLAARASKTRPNLALVPIGALLMGAFSLDLALTVSGLVKSPEVLTVGTLLKSVSGWRVLVDLAGLAVAGGLFIVPSFAAVQLWAPVAERARTIGACNVMSALFMTAGSLGVALLQWQGASLGLLLVLLGAGNLVAMALILRAWGKQGVQDVGAFLFKTFMGLEVKGYENLPPEGTRTIIAPNHVSLLDAPIMHSILPSHAAFAIDTGMAQKSWIKPFLKLVKAHAIDPTKPLGTRHLIQAVKAGETLVIFPEGRLTVTGGLMKVYDGTAMIADKADAVIVPVRIDGPERSYFGYLNRFQARKSLFPKTTVTILPPVKLAVPEGLKGKARRQAAGMALQDLMVDTAVRTANLDQTLFSALVEAKATRDTGKPAIEDPLGTQLSYGKLILGAQVLGAKLAPLAPEGAAVGVMLPNSAGVAVTFFALQTIGRVPAMLNFTAGPNNIEAACTAAKVDVVLTSRTFVEKAHLEAVVAKLSEQRKIVYLEDVKASISFSDKMRGLLLGSRPQVVRKANDPAAILFTSGSEGLPKGVVLSHRNMLANAMQSLTRVAVNGQDKVFNVLPVFHSFGLTAGLVMPLVGGVPVYLYPTPLHYRIVPELVYGSNATILFGTDTFLNGYARSAHPYDFARVRLILAGAEAVKERTRQIYMEKFGVRILEGYGVTETAPVLAINTPLANKSGTVGRLSPLMEARLEAVPGIEGAGRLYVRGPNVMLGYMRAENPGVLEPPADGWHDTGDIVAIDEHGFISIKGRAKRFAKIAGEMVSLSAVEALATELWPAVTSVVVALPDARKGERLVLMTTDTSATRDAFGRYARQKGANELMVPADILVVPGIPLLGSGKPDYVAALQLAKEKMASAPRRAEALVPEPQLGPGGPMPAV